MSLHYILIEISDRRKKTKTKEGVMKQIIIMVDIIRVKKAYKIEY